MVPLTIYENGAPICAVVSLNDPLEPCSEATWKRARDIARLLDEHTD